MSAVDNDDNHNTGESMRATTTTTTTTTTMSTTTIALFGATGRTGREFLNLALQKGHVVKALVRDTKKIDHDDFDSHKDSLTVIEGSVEDTVCLERTVSGAQYVVCMVAAPGNDETYPQDFMFDLVKRLCPLLEKANPEVFLYQAGSMSCDGDGHLHPVSLLAKHTLGRRLQILSKIADNDAAIQYIQEHSNGYHFIVTRAGVLVDGPPSSLHAAAASTWPPLPYWNTMTYADLAAFTLKALSDESLYDKCPFVK